MAEFKAQILGILIVITVFGALVGLYKTMTTNTVNQVSTKVSQIVQSA